MELRSTRSEDISALKLVLDGAELFPSELLPDMLSGFLSNEECEDIWLSVVVDGEPIGFCYAIPEPLTDGTWNMLAIAVLPAKQGLGAGAAIINELETNLREKGARVLIADTSGTDTFVSARAFYRQNGYSEEARIRDFWAAGDDKVVFWKRL